MKTPATKQVLARKTAAEKKAPRKPNKSLKDFKEEEATEADTQPVRPFAGQKPVTPEDIVVGDNYKFVNWSDAKWVDKEGKKVMVAYFYPTQNVAIDFPDTVEDLKAKQAFFKSIKLPYLGVLPGEPLRAVEARRELKQLGAKIAA